MNVGLLRKVQKSILEEPRRLMMELYMDVDTGNGLREDYPACGTVGCIAGWSLILDKDPQSAEEIRRIGRIIEGAHGVNVGDDAAAILGLDVRQKMTLFYVSNWPEEFRERYYDALTAADRTQVTSDYIDHFIEKGGAV